MQKAFGTIFRVPSSSAQGSNSKKSTFPTSGLAMLTSSLHLMSPISGVVLDQNLNMDRHISRTSKSAFFHLHNIRRISKYLDQESLLTLTHAFITSRLDYCNSLLYGAPVTQIEKLQRIQNAAARLITRSPKFCHMGPILRQLHWLPIRSRIHHKILTLTFKSIHSLAPSYLSELITGRFLQ